MQPEHPINSRAWWDDYFRHHWDANHGSAQTAYFMGCLVAGLSRHEAVRSYLETRPLEILDWGCAFGEGAQRLAEEFPLARVAGLDFSREAVRVARRRYPMVEFLDADGGPIPRDFDVVVTSNCLEHFDDPISEARGHLASCRKLYLAMVPYREEPLCESHRARFDESTFPEAIGGFRRLFQEVIETEPPFWHGRQFLVAYGSAGFLADLGLGVETAQDDVADRERRKWDAYYATIAEPEESPATLAFGDELTRRIAEFLPDGGQILEAGCGAGQQSMALARDGRYRLHLMDFSEEALGHARRWFEKAGLAAEFEAGDVLAPGRPEFDLVFNAGVLEHYTFEEQVKFLRGMASRSRRFVLALVPNPRCYWYWIWRLRAASGGEWPFGKEVPMSHLGEAFEAAGLTFLGQFVGGARWSENFIDYLPGLDPALRDLILAAHRSPVIPDWQRGYLIGALGSKGERPRLSASWATTWPVEGYKASEATAALADSLALAVAGEQRLARSRAEADSRLAEERAEAQARVAASEAARAEAEAAWSALLDAERAERDALTARHAERVAAFAASEAALRARVDENIRVIAGLTSRIDELTARAESERVEAARHAADQESRLEAARLRIEELAWWADTQAAEIRAMRAGKAWRLVEFGRDIRRRLAPSGSLPSRAARLGLRAVRKARQGPGPFAGAVARAIARRWHASRGLATLPPAAPIVRDLPAQAGPAFGVPGLVSVVLPVYNQADLLADSIESVLAQTYEDFELIIVDDGSTDGVERVLAEYAGRPRVRVLSQGNQKLPKALSNGFEFARGEFWTWTSADNLMHPEQLARQVEFLRANPDAAMVYADYLAIDDRGEPLRDPNWRPHNRLTPDDHAIHLPRDAGALNVVQDNFIGPCFMYRGWVGRLVGEYDPNLGVEDYDYWMRINRSFGIRHLGTDETLYSYRVHDNSLSGRAAELRIVERAAKLMEYERDRAAFREERWTLIVDEEVAGLLGDSVEGVCRTLVWDGGPCPGLDPMPEKALLLVGAASLSVAGLPETPIAAAWFAGADVEAPYELRGVLRARNFSAFTPDPATRERLSLLNVEAFAVGAGDGLLPFILAWADDRLFYRRTRPESVRRRETPRAFQPIGRRIRAVIQVDGFTQGGMEQVVLSIAETLDPRRFQLSLLVLGEQGGAVERARAAGLRVVTLPEPDRERHYRAFLADEGIDLVNAHYSTFGASSAADLGIPFVQTVHNAYVWLDPASVDTYRAADRATTAYICVSDEVARYSEIRLGLPASKMLVFPNGVRVGRSEGGGGPVGRAALRARFGIAPRDFVFLNVASVHATKAQVPAVLALAEVVKTHPATKILFLGRALDPAYLAELRREVDRNGLGDAVILAGHHDDPAPFYRAADAFLLPSYWEGWSLALAEALDAGLPVVATDVGAARDLVAPEFGTLVRPPFRSITDLDWLSIAPLIREHDRAFVARLAVAMRACRDRQARIVLAPGLRDSIDQRNAYLAYGELFAWVAQGGRPEAARVWGRPSHHNDRAALSGGDATRAA